MPEPRQTKDQRRAAAQEAARQMRQKQKRIDRRNRIFLIGGSTLAILAIFAVVAVVLITSNRGAGPGPANMASDGVVFTGSDAGVKVVETKGIPEGGTPTPTDTTALGDKVKLNIVTYIDFLCPYCNQFETTNAATIQSLVESGVASLEVHPIAILDNSSQGTKYSTRAANAAACVAAYEPDKFLAVQSAFFANQPAEQTTGLKNSELIDLIKGAGVTDEQVEPCVNDQRFAAWVTSATTRALANPDLKTADGKFGTPRVLVNGVMYSGGVSDPTAFQEFLAQAAVAANNGDGSTPTPTPSPTN